MTLGFVNTEPGSTGGGTPRGGAVVEGRVTGSGYGGTRELNLAALQTREATPETPKGRNGEKVPNTRNKEMTPQQRSTLGVILKDTLRLLIEKQAELENEVPPRNFREWLQNSGRIHYQQYMDTLTWFPPGEEGRGKSVNEAALQQLLSTQAGSFNILNTVKTDYVLSQAFEGTYEDVNLQSPNPNNIKTRSTLVNEQKGAWLWRAGRAVNEYMSEDLTRSHGRGRARNFPRNRWQALTVILATGVVPGLIVAGTRRATKPGVTLVTRQSQAALRVAQRYEAAMGEWMRDIEGKDVRDLEAGGNAFDGNRGAVRMRPGRMAKSSMNVERRQEDLKGIGQLLFDIDTRLRDRHPETAEASDIAYLLRGEGSRADRLNRQQGGTRLEIKAMKRFFLEPGDPGYDANVAYRGPGIRNIAENVQRYLKIKLELLEQETTDTIESVLGGNLIGLNEMGDSIERVRESVRNDEGAKRTLETRRTSQERDKKVIDRGAGGFDGLNTKIDQARPTIDAARERQTQARDRVIITGWVAPVGSPPGTRPTAAEVETALRGVLNGTGVEVTIEGNPVAIRSIADQLADLDTRISTDVDTYRANLGLTGVPGGLEDAYANAQADLDSATGMPGAPPMVPPATPAQIAEFRRRVGVAQTNLRDARAEATSFSQQRNSREWRAEQTAIINANRDIVQEVLSTMTDAGNEMRSAREGMTSERRIVNETLDALQGAPARFRARFIGPTTFTIVDPATGAILIDLRTREFATQRPEEMQTRINQLYALDVTNGVPVANRRGWPPEVNDVALNRSMLLYAMAEAQAMRNELSLVAPSDDLTAMVDPAIWNINEVDIFLLSAAEIRDNMLAAIAGGGGLPPALSVDQIETVKDEVVRRYNARRNALHAVSGMVNEEIQATSRSIENGVPTPQLDDLDKARLNYPSIMELFRKTAVSGSRESYDEKYLRFAAATAREYSPAEAGYVVGYLELLNAVFDYQSSANREQAFRTALELLPPERLTEMLEGFFDLRVIARNYNPATGTYNPASPLTDRPVANINEAIWALRDRFELEAVGPGTAAGDYRVVPDEPRIDRERFAYFMSEYLMFDQLNRYVGDAGRAALATV